MQRHVQGEVRNKPRLFNATDFQSLMYPCFIFGRILGIFPYNLNTSTSIASKRYILLSVIVCASCVLNFLLIHSFINMKFNFDNIIKNLQAISYFMLAGVLVISTHIFSGPRMRLLKTILEISSKLPLESYQKMSRFIHVKDILVIILRIIQISIFFYKMGFEVNYISIMIMAFIMYCLLLVLQVHMLYINCVCILKACFKRLNDNLAHMQKLIINDVQLPALNLIYPMQRNQFLLVELKILKKQHMMISDTVKMLNTVFSMQLLLIMAMTFSNITFEVYFYVVRWQDGMFFSIEDKFLEVFLMLIIYYTFKMALLGWACQTGKNQAREIGTTIHDLLNSTNDEKMKNELRLFSLQLLHHENTFSATGHAVDATFLKTLVGKISIYLLILIQFLKMSHFCDTERQQIALDNDVIEKSA